MNKPAEEVQEQYVALQILDHQIKQAQKQIIAIEEQVTELESVMSAVAELASQEASSEMFVPLSSGIFVKTTLKETKQVLVNVGANVLVKKEVAQTQELLQAQMNELRDLQQQIAEQVQKFATEAQTVQEKVQSMMEK